MDKWATRLKILLKTAVRMVDVQKLIFDLLFKLLRFFFFKIHVLLNDIHAKTGKKDPSLSISGSIFNHFLYSGNIPTAY